MTESVPLVDVAVAERAAFHKLEHVHVVPHKPCKLIGSHCDEKTGNHVSLGRLKDGRNAGACITLRIVSALIPGAYLEFLAQDEHKQQARVRLYGLGYAHHPLYLARCLARGRQLTILDPMLRTEDGVMHVDVLCAQGVVLTPGAVRCAAVGCSQPSSSTGTCSRCRVVRYCSRECQQTDWPSHKTACCRFRLLTSLPTTLQWFHSPRKGMMLYQHAAVVLRTQEDGTQQLVASKDIACGTVCLVETALASTHSQSTAPLEASWLRMPLWDTRMLRLLALPLGPRAVDPPDGTLHPALQLYQKLVGACSLNVAVPKHHGAYLRGFGPGNVVRLGACIHAHGFPVRAEGKSSGAAIFDRASVLVQRCRPNCGTVISPRGCILVYATRDLQCGTVLTVQRRSPGKAKSECGGACCTGELVVPKDLQSLGKTVGQVFAAEKRLRMEVRLTTHNLQMDNEEAVREVKRKLTLLHTVSQWHFGCNHEDTIALALLRCFVQCIVHKDPELLEVQLTDMQENLQHPFSLRQFLTEVSPEMLTPQMTDVLLRCLPDEPIDQKQ